MQLKHKQRNCSFFSLSLAIASFNTVFMALIKLDFNSNMGSACVQLRNIIIR